MFVYWIQTKASLENLHRHYFTSHRSYLGMADTRSYRTYCANFVLYSCLVFAMFFNYPKGIQKPTFRSCGFSRSLLLLITWMYNTFLAMLWIHDILVRIRIRGSVPLTNGSGSGSNSWSASFLQWLKKCKIIYFFIFFSYKLPAGTIKILFCKHYCRKGKDLDPDPQHWFLGFWHHVILFWLVYSECEFCHIVLRNRTFYEAHRKTHLPSKEFACSHCPKLFKTRVQQEIHEARHTGQV